ncbi:acyltransferase [Sphingopyxis sp. LARHCG72]
MQNPFDPGYYCSEELRGFGFAHVGENVQIAKNCTIIGLEHISFGDHVRIDGFTTLVAAAPMTFGNRIHVGGLCHFVASEPLTMGDFFGASQGVKIYTASDDYTGRGLVGPMVPAELRRATRRPIALGDFTLIGANSILLPGANMAEGATLGAQSLSAKPMEEWTIYFGAPAKRVKSRSRRCVELAASIGTQLEIAA